MYELSRPWATPGCYREPQKAKELWKGGWLHTEDLAAVDEEGNVLIVDRTKGAVKSGRD